VAVSTLTLVFVLASAFLVAFLAWKYSSGTTKTVIDATFTLGAVARAVGFVIIAFAFLISGNPVLIALAWVIVAFGAALIIGRSRGEDVI
jgi:hypothetical protein